MAAVQQSSPRDSDRLTGNPGLSRDNGPLSPAGIRPGSAVGSSLSGGTHTSPALDEHLINRSLLDSLDAHDAIDFNPSVSESHSQAELTEEANNLMYPPPPGLQPSAPFRASAPFAHSLRHHPSASDALRTYAPPESLQGAAAGSGGKPSFPQELYSSAQTIPGSDPTSTYPRSTSGSDYDFSTTLHHPQPSSSIQPLNSSLSTSINVTTGMNGLSSPPPNLSSRPSPNFSTPTFSGPTSMLMAKPPSHNGLQPPQALYTAVPSPPGGFTGPHGNTSNPNAPTAQLVQILSSLPPQQKNAVIGRLQELAMAAPAQAQAQSQSLPPTQSQGIPSQPLPFGAQGPGSQGGVGQPPMSQSSGPGAPGIGGGAQQGTTSSFSGAGGQNQEDISTIFVVGFPDDMTEREFQNMFTFCPGYEAATLKVPAKDPPAPSNPAVAAAASALAGASDPYNLVTIASGGVVVDSGTSTTTTSSTWASGIEADPFTRQALAAVAANSTSSTSELAQQLALAQQGSGNNNGRKQIIGFAKFRSKEEAMAARDILHGRKVDVEKGSLLKAEMAKKNLHTKRGVSQSAANASNGNNGNNNSNGVTGVGGGGGNGSVPNFAENPTPVPGASSKATQNGAAAAENSLASPFSGLSTGNSPGDLGRPKGVESPTFKLQRLNEIQPFVPSSAGANASGGGTPTLVTGGEFYSTSTNSFVRNGPSHQPSLPSLTEGRSTEGGFHTLPSKPISDIVKANALPPTNLPPPSSTSSRRPTSSQGGSPPSVSGQEDGYVSDALSTSHMSERSRAESGRFGRYTPPNAEESQLHLPQHLLQDDVLGTPQQTDYANKLMDGPGFTDSDWSTTAVQHRKMTEPTAALGGINMGPFSPANELGPSMFAGSSASSAAGSVSSGGAESVSTSTTSGGNIFPPPHLELGRQRGQTMPSMRSVMNGHPSSGGEGRSSAEHPRRGANAADHNPPINTLYVGNLPTSLTNPGQAKILEDALVQLFSRAPGYSKLCFRQKHNGPMCFVEFDDVSNATKALSDLYGNTLNGLVKGGGIRLSYSKNPLGVRTAAPGSSNNKVTSPIHSPTGHASYQFVNIPSMQDRNALPMDMPRVPGGPGRSRGDAIDRMMGPASPPGNRFMPASPPNGSMSAFGAISQPGVGFGRGPLNMNLGIQPQPFAMASSPPATSSVPTAYQPATTFQPFGQLDMNREHGQPGNEPAPGG